MFDSVAREFSGEKVLGVFGGYLALYRAHTPRHIPPMSLTGTVVKAVSCSSSFVRDRSWMRRAGDTEVRYAVVPSIHVQEWSTFRFAVLVIFLTFNATSGVCPNRTLVKGS